MTKVISKEEALKMVLSYTENKLKGGKLWFKRTNKTYTVDELYTIILQPTPIQPNELEEAVDDLGSIYCKKGFDLAPIRIVYKDTLSIIINALHDKQRYENVIDEIKEIVNRKPANTISIMLAYENIEKLLKDVK